MNRICNLFIFILSVMCSGTVLAEILNSSDIEVISMTWSKFSDGSISASTVKPGNPFKAIIGEVRKENGKKQLYFIMSGSGYSCLNDPNLNYSSEGNNKHGEQTWLISNKEVKMEVFCMEGEWNATPKNEVDKKFVISEFIKSSSVVSIFASAPNIEFGGSLSALGFSDVWHGN